MADLTDLYALEKMYDWEVQTLCQSCQHAMTIRQPEKTITELSVSGNLYCQSCGLPAGDRRLVTGRLYIVGLGTERTPTDKEKTYFTSLIARLDKATMLDHEKRFLRVVDRIAGLLVPRLGSSSQLTAGQQYRLVPEELRSLIDDLGYFFTEGLT